MKTQSEKVIEKVRRLLAIGNNEAASEAEIETVMRMANRLIAEHHLSEAELTEEPQTQYNRLEDAEKSQGFCWIGKKLYNWELALSWFVSNLTGVPFYSRNKQRKQVGGMLQFDSNGNPIEVKSMVFYGLSEDVEIACELFDETRSLIATLALGRYGSVFKGDGAAYAQGFVAGLEQKLQEQRRVEKIECDSEGGNRSLALVRRNDLVKRKGQIAKEWLRKEKGIRLRTGSGSGGTRTGSSSAFSNGRTDGRNANVTARAARRKIAN